MIICVLYFDSEVICFFFFKQKTAYEIRISDWSSDVCSSDLFSPLSTKIPCSASRVRSRFPSRRYPKPAIPSYDQSLGQHLLPEEIGRASCRERVCQYV